MPTTESNRKTLYLIDGSAYIYRAFFALPALNNSQGLQTNAILGFTSRAKAVSVRIRCRNITPISRATKTS